MSLSRVDLRGAKLLARKLLPKKSIFRGVLEEENDLLTVSEFHFKVVTWLSTLRAELELKEVPEAARQ